jgi:hypothetical protein
MLNNPATPNSTSEPIGDAPFAVKRVFYAVTVFNFLCLVFYQCVTYRRYFHSDSAIKNLLAQELIESRSLFPPDWFYGNSDVWIAYSHLFIVPLLALLPNGFKAHALSGVAFSLLLGASAWWLLKRASIPAIWRALALAILFSGISPYLSETLYGQVSHGYAWGLVYVFLFLSWLPDSVSPNGTALRHRSSSAYLVWLLLSAVLFVGGLTGIRMAFAIVIPVLVICSAMAAYFWVLLKPAKSWLLVAAWLAVSWLVGFLMHKYWIGHLHYIDLSQAQRWADFSHVATNFRCFVEGWFLNAGISLEPDQTGTYLSLYRESVTSFRGMEFVYRFLLNLFLFFLPWYLALWGWQATSSPWLRAMLMYYLVGFVLTLVLFLFSDGLAITAASIRYFTVFHVLSLMIAVFWLAEMSKRLGGYRLAVITLIALIPLFAFSWRHQIGDAFVRTDTGRYQRALSRFDPLLHVLREKNLRHGYASFWNAAAPTVLSDHQILIRALYVSDAGLVPMHLLSAKRHYEMADHSSFLVLQHDETVNEVAQFGSIIERQLGPAAMIYRVPGFEVRTFSFNILNKLGLAASN